jgi:Protein of unknown function (DUF4242)
MRLRTTVVIREPAAALSEFPDARLFSLALTSKARCPGRASASMTKTIRSGRPAGLSLFLVERYVAGPPEERLAGISSRLRKAASELVANGVEVRYVQSILLNGEESCLCLFQAPSETEVRLVNERAGLAYLRIVPATAATGQPLDLGP